METFGPENVVDVFTRDQAELLYVSQGLPPPPYLSLFLTSPFCGADEPTSLFGFLERELRAAKSGQVFHPSETELGSENLKAYEAAKELAKSLA